MEWRRRLRVQAGQDRPRHVAALRHGHRRHAGWRLAGLMATVGQVAADEDLGMPGLEKLAGKVLQEAESIVSYLRVRPAQ